MQTLLSDAYNADRRKLIDPAKASLDQRPGKVEGYGGRGEAAPRRRLARRRGGQRRRRADGRPPRCGK
jgi:hypothetical protein